MLCDVAKRWEYSGPPVGEPLGVFLFSSDVLVWAGGFMFEFGVEDISVS